MAQEPPWIDLMSSSTVKSLRKFSAVNRRLARRDSPSEFEHFATEVVPG